MWKEEREGGDVDGVRDEEGEVETGVEARDTKGCIKGDVEKMKNEWEAEFCDMEKKKGGR